MQFKDAVHLRCFIHFRRNLSDKLKELGVAQTVASKILGDVFGYACDNDDDALHTNLEATEMPLVDAENDDAFDEILVKLKDKWNELESSCTGKAPLFYSWFNQYKACDIKESMLASLRSAIGLGNPPCKYTTNSNESINAMIHGKNHYNAKNWADFCSFIKELVDVQRKEIELAIVSKGEYRISSEYSKYMVSEEMWWKLTPSQRRRKISAFFSAADCKLKTSRDHTLSSNCSATSRASCIEEEPNYSHTPSRKSIAVSPSTSNIPLSIPHKSTGITTLSEVHLQNLWSKAALILSKKSNIVAAPGASSTYMVISLSNDTPNKVTVHPAGKLVCNCMSYTSSKICAHALSTAEFCDSLFDYIAWYKKMKCKPSASYLSSLGKPKTAGKKGNTSPAVAQGSTSALRQDNSRTRPASNSLLQDDSMRETSLPLSDDSSITLATTSSATDIDSNRLSDSVMAAAEDHSTKNYFIAFLNNRIKKCYGCGQPFNKALDGTVLPPPSDICILHKDIREFIKNGKTCKSPHPQNTYYHPSIACITKRNKRFETKFLNPLHICDELLPIHKQFLLDVFGLKL